VRVRVRVRVRVWAQQPQAIRCSRVLAERCQAPSDNAFATP